MSNVIFNNFTGGIVSPKMAGNYGSAIYHNGCRKLENFSVMLQGGITRRPPSLLLRKAIYGNTILRLIPFTIDVDQSYFIGLGSGKFCMFQYNTTTKTFTTAVLLGANDTFWSDTPFDAADLDAIQYAQSADTLYLVHPSYHPQKICKNGTYYTCSNINATLTRYTDAQGHTDQVYDPMGEKESGTGNDDIFKSANNYPSVVAFLNNRLWLASSNNHLIRYWASRPFDHEKFWYYEMVRTENTEYSADYVNAYISAKEYSSSSAYAVGDYCIHSGSYYKCKTAIAEGGEAWNASHWDELLPGKTYTVRATVTDDCAIRFDASGNDAIRWISAKNNIIVGTASGEYAIPGNANGNNYQLSDLSSYGSQKGAVAVQANSEVIFPQAGGKKIRSITAGNEGYACVDLTYHCDRLIAEHNGVKRMAWRRVPDPTLYVVLNDGTMAVLFYDRGYGLMAWAHWSFGRHNSTDLAVVKDVIVCDTPEGQQTLLYVTRGSASYVERLSDVDASEGLTTAYKDWPGQQSSTGANDGNIAYTSEMQTNPYEFNSSTYGSSLGKKKRIRAFTCRTYKSTAFEAGYDERYMKSYSGSQDFNDVEILTPGGYENFVQMTVRSVGSNPLTVLAFSLDLEAER